MYNSSRLRLLNTRSPDYLNAAYYNFLCLFLIIFFFQITFNNNHI